MQRKVKKITKTISLSLNVCGFEQLTVLFFIYLFFLDGTDAFLQPHCYFQGICPYVFEATEL